MRSLSPKTPVSSASTRDTASRALQASGRVFRVPFARILPVGIHLAGSHLARTLLAGTLLAGTHLASTLLAGTHLTRTLLASTLLAGILLSGCGYTVLQNPNRTADVTKEDPAVGISEDELPPGHPPIDEPPDWAGRSFLDEIVGIDEPYRFENVRQLDHLNLPSEKSQLTLRMHVGSSAVADIWQVRVDEFGWVTVSQWIQGATGPELDESLASRRVEFRLDHASEAALRIMILGLLPDMQRARTFPSLNFHGLDHAMWGYSESGLLTLDYRVEALNRLENDWPGGTLKGPLDLIQLLIGTWDSPPAEELQVLIYRVTNDYPSLIPVAMMVEALVLIWEIEGAEQDRIELPLEVGR